MTLTFWCSWQCLIIKQKLCSLLWMCLVGALVDLIVMSKSCCFFIKTTVTSRQTQTDPDTCAGTTNTRIIYTNTNIQAHTCHTCIQIHINTHTHKLTNTYIHTQRAVFKSYFLVELVQPLQEVMIPLVPLSARFFQLYQRQLDDLQKIQDCVAH